MTGAARGPVSDELGCLSSAAASFRTAAGPIRCCAGRRPPVTLIPL